MKKSNKKTFVLGFMDGLTSPKYVIVQHIYSPELPAKNVFSTLYRSEQRVKNLVAKTFNQMAS